MNSSNITSNVTNIQIDNYFTDNKIIEFKQMKVVGKSIRTTNKDWQSMKDQPAFWQKFFDDKIADSIPNKINSGKILGIYYNYESDYTGAFNFLIGFEVLDFTSIQEGLEKIIIPEGRYLIFKTPEKINLGEKVVKIWQNIWSSGVKRSYTYDIEEYDLLSMFSDNPDVNIFIGSKI